MNNEGVNKLCFEELGEKIQEKSIEFLQIHIDDPKRLETFYPFTNKTKYYECVEEVIKDAVKRHFKIQIDDIFEDEYDFPYLSDLCFFVKGILGSLGNFEILWFIESDVEGIIIDKREDGTIAKITTREDVDCQLLFKALMFELKQECYRMEGYNLDEQKLKKMKLNKEENKND